MDRPVDECPYPKPFPADFDDCPAFQPREFIPLDTLYQPLEPVVTCRHLETRVLPQRYRWYAACRLGDSEARKRWAEAVGVERLQRIRALQGQISQVMAPYSRRLWSLKGQQLEAFRDSADGAPITAQLRELSRQAIASLEAFLEAHEKEYAEVEIPMSAARDLIKIALDRFITTRYASEISFEVPDDVLQRFPFAVRNFFRPAAAVTASSS